MGNAIKNAPADVDASLAGAQKQIHNKSQKEICQANKTKLFEMLSNASKDKPVTRKDIMDKFNVGDRYARLMIEELRDEGVRINGTPRTKGYWLIKSEQEYRDFRAVYITNAQTIKTRVRNMDKQKYKKRGGIYGKMQRLLQR